MGNVYRYQSVKSGRHVRFAALAFQLGISIETGPTGATLPDEEIPNLISALQNYMSKRAAEITKAAKAEPEGWVWE